jgi:hypothetical protein
MEIDHGSGEEPSGESDQASDVGANGGNRPIASSSSNNDESFEENGAPPSVNGSSIAGSDGKNRRNLRGNAAAAANCHGPPLSYGSSNADSADEPPNQASPASSFAANGDSDREHPQAPPANGAAVAIDEDDEDVMVDITGSSSQGGSSQSGKDSSETSSSGDGTSSSGTNATTSSDTVKMEDMGSQVQVSSSSDAADTPTSSGAKAAASDDSSMGSFVDRLELEIPVMEDMGAQAQFPTSSDAADTSTSSGAKAAAASDDSSMGYAAPQMHCVFVHTLYASS